MKKILLASILFSLCIYCSMCRKAQPIDESTYDERLSGGAATVFDETSKALGHEIPGLNARDAAVHELGDVAFSQTMVSDPAPQFGGLGPVYNNVSCISCHHNDGKGTPTAGNITSSLLTRVATGGVNEHGGPIGMEGFGGQIQDLSVQGVLPEAKVDISYADKIVNYPDGSTATLRVPHYQLTNTYIPLATHQLSPRLAPPVFGLGLLENIPEQSILNFALANQAKNGKIKGHANYVYNPYTKRMELGRFGLKANNPSLLIQVAGAYQQDMGITSSVFPLENCYGQAQMSAVYQPGKPNLPDSILQAVVFYVKSLAVPARRNTTNESVKKGAHFFAQLECSSCHIPTVFTGVDLGYPQLSNQRIHPYTDMLLHDMGDDLADGYSDYLATGKEWKTPALWGIGLYPKTNGTAYYLHDGRARTLEEAILWHGGEAQESKEAFMRLSSADRLALIKFIESL